MDYETAKITKVTGKCPACEDYAEKNSTNPPKIAVMACEGACARGEVARRAANLVAHRLARDETVRICLGGAFTKDTGQRNLIRRAEKVIAIEGCFINCSSRMMAGVIPELQPEIVRADLIYNLDLPFGIDEVPDEMFTVYAYKVAEQVVRELGNGKKTSAACLPLSCGTGPVSGGCGCSARLFSCSAGPGDADKNAPAQQYLPPDVVDVHWDGAKKFHVKNARGGSMALEEGSEQCSPCDAFMAALGGCANLAILAQLQKNNIVPSVLEVQVSGIRKTGIPAAYEKIHVMFSISSEADNTALDTMIKQAMTVFCPVAVTLGRAVEVTWSCERIKAI